MLYPQQLKSIHIERHLMTVTGYFVYLLRFASINTAGCFMFYQASNDCALSDYQTLMSAIMTEVTSRAGRDDKYAWHMKMKEGFEAEWMILEEE
uniref:DUF4936 family protein n=1 Tax=Steinernema glaseri TaxID=37863 RepID=A0A1I8A7I6_9BILA